MNSSDTGSGHDYAADLAHAKTSNLSAVEGTKAVIVVQNADGSYAEDGFGNKVVMLTPCLIPNDKDSNAWEETFLLFLRETEEIVTCPYRIIYVHSGFSPPLWFGWWLIGLRARLSRAHRKNIAALSVIHPTVAIRFLFLALRPLVSSNFWKKVHYADRIELLWLDDILSESTVRRCIPHSVMAYEGLLVEEAEQMREAAIQFGVPLMAREGPIDSNGSGHHLGDSGTQGTR